MGENTGSAAMPLTRPEQLEMLEIGESILIDEVTRSGWARATSRYTGEKKFIIRTDRETLEIRVWRLK